MKKTKKQEENATETENGGDSEELTPAEKRRREFFRRSRERSGYEHEWYISKRTAKKPLLFETTGGDIAGLLGHFRVYEFDVKVRRVKEPLKLAKLNTFTISALKDQKYLKQFIKSHKATKDKKLEPKAGAGYNPPLAEGIVEKAMTEKKQLALMLLNGTIIIGVPVEESLYSILMKVPDTRGAEILVFKHGLAGSKLFEEIQGV